MIRLNRVEIIGCGSRWCFSINRHFHSCCKALQGSFLFSFVLCSCLCTLFTMLFASLFYFIFFPSIHWYDSIFFSSCFLVFALKKNQYPEFKNQICHKTGFPALFEKVDLHDTGFVFPRGNKLWELPFLHKFTHQFTAGSTTPRCLLGPEKTFHLSCCFLIPAVYSFMWPNLPQEVFDLVTIFYLECLVDLHLLSLLIYFNSCLPKSFVLSICPTVSMFLVSFLVFFWVYWVCSLTPLFFLYTSKVVLSFHSFSG